MKKTYMIPEMETIELKTKGALLIPASKSDGTPTEWGAPSYDDWDDDFDEE